MNPFTIWKSGKVVKNATVWTEVNLNNLEKRVYTTADNREEYARMKKDRFRGDARRQAAGHVENEVTRHKSCGRG